MGLLKKHEKLRSKLGTTIASSPYKEGKRQFLTSLFALRGDPTMSGEQESMNHAELQRALGSGTPSDTCSLPPVQHKTSSSMIAFF